MPVASLGVMCLASPRSVLMPVADESPSFPLALGDEGQWKGTSFVEDQQNSEKEQMHPDPFSGL